jgi:hypothetical protein
MVIDHFYKSYAETVLASLHYVTFIEPLAVFLTEVQSFDFDDFTINSMKKVIEEKINDPFVPLEEYFFAVVLLYKKNYEVEFEDMSYEVIEFFYQP